MDPVEVTAQSLRSVSVGKSFLPLCAQVRALSFSTESRYLFAETEDGKVLVFGVAEGKHTDTFSDPSGVRLTTPTHHSHAVLYTASSVPTQISYFDWRYRHSIWQSQDPLPPINWLGMSPSADCFLSLSEDATGRLFDLRRRRCVSTFPFPADDNCASAAMDPSGTVFAICTTDRRHPAINLFDIRNTQQGPYICKKLIGSAAVSCFEFSDDGTTALACTGNTEAHLLDSMQLDITRTVRLPQPAEGKMLATFTACSQYLLAGAKGHTNLHVYDRNSAAELCTLKRDRGTTAMSCSHDYFLFAAAGEASVDLYLPDL